MKKKILFIGPFPPPVHGASLRNQSIADSRLINEHFNMKIFRANQAGDVHDIGRFSWKKIFRTFRDTKNLIGTLFSFKPDLVYFNISLFGFALYRDSIYTTIFKLFGFKLLYHLRTQGVKEQVENSVFKKWLFHFLFHHVNVICLSQALYKDIALVFKGTPFIVNNGIAVVDSHIQPEGNSENIITILFLSNYSVKKGIEELLLAVQTLKQKQYRFRVMLVGKDFDYTAETLRMKVAAMDIDHEVNIMGPLYDREKYKVLQETDIFVLPTYFEAFPGVILEAMQFALPVVSTREGAIPEIVDDGKTGLLVEKKDVEALAGALSTLIYDTALRKKMGQSGQHKFFQNYTLEIFEKNMVSVFRQVLDNAQ